MRWAWRRLREIHQAQRKPKEIHKAQRKPREVRQAWRKPREVRRALKKILAGHRMQKITDSGSSAAMSHDIDAQF